MRFSFRLCCALAAACLGLSLAARAQFQEPTKEELAMTEDAKAPGACAVYLDYDEKTDDPLHYHSVHARIKVLQEKCKELATVNVPYFHGETKITDITGRTIHPDGTVVPLAGKPEDLLTEKNGETQIGHRVFNLPSVTVGSILEYQYDIRYDDNTYSSPWWFIQGKYFMHRAHYSFLPFKGFQPGQMTSMYLEDEKGRVADRLLYWTILPTGTSLVHDAGGRFNVDLSDVPATPDEEYMPPLASFYDQVRFYYSYATSGGDYWVSEAKNWSKEVDHFAEPTKPIQDAVASIVAPGDSQMVKAQKLYKAVQALDNTDFSRQKGKAELKALGMKQAKRAEDTWARKSGSKQDITLLYLAMLRAAGIAAYDLKVVNRNEGVFQPNMLNFGQLDDDVVLATIDGKEIPLDPGEKMCPFKTLDWIHAGAMGVRQTADGHGALSATPLLAYTANPTLRVGDITIDAHGTIAGNLRFIMSGQGALGWRQMALEQGDEEIHRRFDRMLEEVMPEGVHGHLDHFLGLDDPDTNLMAMVKVEGTLGTATAKRLLIPGFFFESRGSSPFVAQEKRLSPIDMRYADQVQDRIEYHLPEGLKVEGAPADNVIAWKPNAVLEVKVTQAPGQVTVMRTFSRGFTLLKADQYQDLRGFYQKVAASDQQLMSLAVVQKGN